ncbi:MULTISPECIES: uroporphyrinogen-III synthase [Rhizobium]|uniref:Uroporphyrinogen-III synthase n=1 Tax=Rhizobium paranaense TaxID=1650438 RepID=A0A7W9D1M3_9HYPH|nr:MULTISPECIES: uroporphyrinogen-III synthase [Rhizobium]MBB5574011.1 uroporphyrinogen-III synthase [Rhizobium paranaense]PST61284.1 uroporphyrinogen III synthase [Rhizobium sp. SEMIA4064]
MRVVVTRPEHSGERTARRLAEMGHEAVLLPLSKPVRHVDATRQALSNTEGTVAVTSAEAIRTLGAIGQPLKPHLSRPLFAVGKATADEAQKLGFIHVFASEGSGAELAELVSREWTDISQAPLLYLAGSPRAAGFEARLKGLNIPFQTVECYRMQDIVIDDATLRRLFLDASADAVLLYSHLTAKRFFSLPFLQRHSNLLTSTRFLCLSEVIAEAVPTSLHSHVDIANMPDEDSLLALLAAK